MKQYKQLCVILGPMLAALLVGACVFSIQALPTATALPSPMPSPTTTALPPPVTPTAIPASPSPMSIPAVPIGADSLQELEIFKSFKVDDSVRSLAFSPDGQVLADAQGNDKDFTIHLWNTASGQLVGQLSAHKGIVWDLAFSPDGKLLASVSSDKTAKIWDWRAGTLLKELDFSGDVVRVQFSPDGQTLAVGGVDSLQAQTAAIWTYSVNSWEPGLKFSEYMDITALAYSPNGDVLLGGGASRNVQAWKTRDGIRLFTLNHAHQVFQAAISPNGFTVATATCETVAYPQCTNGAVWLWDLRTGKLSGKVTGLPDFVEDVGFTADGSALIATSRDGSLHFYSTSDYQPLFAATPPGGAVTIAVSQNGDLLATGGIRGDIHLWRIKPRP